MGTITVASLMQKAQFILKDEGVHWTVDELQAWLNAAYVELINARPDANPQVDTFNCAAGIRQDLTTAYPTAIKLLEVVRNVAGSSQGRTVRQTTRAALDSSRPTWTSTAQSVDIVHFIPDERTPHQFLVYPPASAAAQLEVVFAIVPAAHALTPAQLEDPNDTTTINVPDVYANMLLDYILYRAFSKDANHPAYVQRAASHYAAIAQSLGLKNQTDSVERPQTGG